MECKETLRGSIRDDHGGTVFETPGGVWNKETRLLETTRTGVQLMYDAGSVSAYNLTILPPSHYLKSGQSICAVLDI